MIIPKTIYQVRNFMLEDLKDAENFDKYLNIFADEELDEIYLGYQSKIDYTIYARPEFNYDQMWQIREGLQQKLDVSIYATPKFNYRQMEQWSKFVKDYKMV